MKKFAVLFLLVPVFALTVFSQTPEAEVPADFVSDGCSWFPDGSYRECCEAHDKDYYNGGTCKQRRESDNRLYRCVRSKPGWKHKVIAPVMWVGVRVMGSSWLPTPFRWGFGKDIEKKNRKMQVFNNPETKTVVQEPADQNINSTTDGSEDHSDSVKQEQIEQTQIKEPIK